MSDESIGNEHPSTATYTCRVGSPKIVIAGEKSEREKIFACLRKEACQFLEAGDGDEARSLARKHWPDILICYNSADGVDGIRLSRRLKDESATRNIFILLIFPDDENDAHKLTLEAEADDYICKPWIDDALLSRVQAGLKIIELTRCLDSRNHDFARVTQRLNMELSVVAQIQKDLLPQEIPSVEGLEFTFFYLPSSECGGDYYDLVRLDDKHMGLVLADVSGHGAPAMVTMAMLRQNFHFIAKDFLEPNLLLEELNRLLFQHLPTDQYATMFYAVINTETLELIYSSAGQTPPIWWRNKSAKCVALDNCEGFPLKLVTDDAKYVSTSIQLEPNDKMVFYTDGVTECFNPKREIFGTTRLEEAVARGAKEGSPRQLESEIVTSLLTFADVQDTEDDVTLVVLGVRGSDQDGKQQEDVSGQPEDSF